jgi:hypothetical protein
MQRRPSQNQQASHRPQRENTYHSNQLGEKEGWGGGGVEERSKTQFKKSIKSE